MGETRIPPKETMAAPARRGTQQAAREPAADGADLYVADPAVELRGESRPLRDWDEELAGRSFLVTGAAGFLGGHLLRRLHDLDLEVTGTVLHPAEARILRERGYRARVLDLAADGPWEEFLEGVDVVFHVAAMFQEAGEPEEAFDRVNQRGAVKLARAAVRAGVDRFVHCSTVGVHGDVVEIPATEETPFNPMDRYHRTKLRGERAVVDLASRVDPAETTITVNRPAMVYGPGDRRLLKLFRAIASGRFVMIGSGQVHAHLGYIEDQTESFLLSAIAPAVRVHGEAFNIASAEPLTLDELARLVADETGVSIPSLRIPVAPVMAAAWLCETICRPLGISPPLFRRRVGFFTHDRAFDYSKARDRLGYESRWSNQEGVAATVSWYREAGWL